MITQYTESLNWLHSLIQELELEGVTLPMGDYNYAFGLIEDVRDNLTDLTWGNTVAYSPSAIRTEVRESLSEYYPDEEWIAWAENATDDELNEVASYILQQDDVWQNFTINLVEGLREGYRWSKEVK